ncbi:MAG: DUF2142 domain-containing protein, partial [Anaerolineales bacterium]
MNKKTWLTLLLALTLVRGLAYAVLIPPWQAPDETGHFEHAWLIAYLGRCPTGDDLSAAFEEDLLASLYEWRFGELVSRALPAQAPTRLADLPSEVFVARSRTVGGRFSLAYVWTALFVRPLLDHDLVVQLYAARFSSIVLELAIVWLAWCIFCAVLPGRPGLVAAMTACVVFLPQHTFINATVGEGALAELGACVVVYAWIRLLLEPPRVRHAAAALAGTLVGMWAKRTAGFLVIVDAVGLALLLSQWFRRAGRRRRAAYTAVGLCLLAITFALAASSPAGRSTLLVV